ncbi:PQQ-dependent sugar dehydrogenase [Gemmobacter denitrificans]|uniref:PQQ-dependent sugar dehydrogenase n=1 Tax=Gemmobacter denitrificans TaxID=3123040 RepID=A0ABU8BS03_9RHOB
MRRRFAAILGLVLTAGPGMAEVIDTSAGPMTITPLVQGLEEPWAVAALPDGAILITERAGRLSLWRDGQRQDIGGLPEVAEQGQGGLLDVMVPRDFVTSREIWLSYAARVPGGMATAAGRGRLSKDGRQLDGFETLWTGEGHPGGRHFGSRLVEATDGTVFLTTGDRGTGPGGMAAQDGQSAAGKVVHLRRDGSLAINLPGWRPGILSVGHRNIQGAALDLQGQLLTVEHGARGGDELNAPQPGRNYGWPVITYGRNYNFLQIGEGSAKEGMEQPLHYWDPSIAPSGLMVYSGRLIPQWQGDIFTGSLNSGFLSRLDPDRPAETGLAEEQILGDSTGRVRDVIEGPDGAIWFLSVIDGVLYRLAP